MNLLLWGCENWSLQQDLLRRLEVFLHHSIQRILHISTTQVQEDRIRNNKIHRLFYDIPCVINMIAARQLGFLGKVVRGLTDAPACRMLTACANTNSSVDALISTTRTALCEISDFYLPESPK
jgi:hypothetical protein